MINKYVCELIEYGIKRGLINEFDRNYATNLILDILKLDEFIEEKTEGLSLENILKNILDYACDKGLIDNNIVVNKFEIQKPTLNDIFIEKVGE